VSDVLQLRPFPFDGHGLTAVVSTRHGGVSTGPYDSLNLGGHVGDDPTAVAENRRRLAAALGTDRLTIADQRHTATVAVVDAALAGRGHDGIADAAEAFPATDALITNVPGTALAILVADCAPVVLFDPVRRAAGVVHSGRAGTLRAVVPRTIEAMMDTFGSSPGDLLIGIGPAIGAASYEIGRPEIAEVLTVFGVATNEAAPPETTELRGAFSPDGDHLLAPSRPGHALFNLTAAIRRQLSAAGVFPHHVHDLAIDTKTNTPDFFSDRSARPCGRFAAIAKLN
jgi:polyphenol oxidase